MVKMALRTSRTIQNRRARNSAGRLNHAVDAGPLSAVHPNLVDRDDEDSHATLSSDSDSSSDSDGESTRLSGLAACFRVVSESIQRMEQAELEMAKAREALRLKAEKQRVELETELTQMLLQTQLQIASLVSQRQSRPSRKRKRVEEDEPSSEGAFGLSLLSCMVMDN